MDKQDFALFLLMRKDMDSLRHTGKLIAQGAHAANHAASEIGRNKFGPTAMARFGTWEKSTEQGFGTTLVFGGIIDEGYERGLRIEDIRTIVECVKTAGHPAGIVIDPSYPLHDGDVIHGFPCETTGWLFGSKNRISIGIKGSGFVPTHREYMISTNFV